MIINRRTSFTNLEYPNPFEDPEWATWAAIPNKTLAASVTSGQSIAYKIPDGAGGWYALRVVPNGVDANSKRCASWGYTYLHEGSVVYLWCNNGSTPAVNRKSLGANGSGGALGGAAGIICGFKETSDIGDENYGVYSTHAPHRVVAATQTFRKWKITFSDDRETERWTRGTQNWDATNSATAAIYCLIDGKPCLSFEDPSSIMGATGATVVSDGQETFDGIYLGTVPMEFYSSGFSVASGLVVGQSGSANGTGGGALGSSQTAVGSALTFGEAPSDNSNGGIAFFDFTRDVFETNQRKELSDSEDYGAYLYKVIEDNHDYTEPYAQKFTAPASLTDCTFTFYVNGVEYEFPSVWPDANKQTANTGDYVTYITGVHIGDTLTVTARYADGKSAGGIYEISMHSLVYGIFLGRYEFLWKETGDYSILLPQGSYQIYMRGAGGAGGTNGTAGNTGAGGTGGAGGRGDLFMTTFSVESDTTLDLHVGAAGLTKANGGNGGTGGTGNGYGGNGGNGGGGGMPTYAIAGSLILYANGGGGGGGAGGGGTNRQARYNGGAGSGAGGGYYRFSTEQSSGYTSLTSRTVYLKITSPDGNNLYITEVNPNESNIIATINVGTTLTENQVILNDGAYLYIQSIDLTTGSFVVAGYTDILGHWDYIPGTITGALTYNSGDILYVSVAGKNGLNGNGGHNGNAGTAGNTTDFPMIYSGKGGEGSDWESRGSKSNGANGGGASGGSGGGTNWNTDYSAGGTGGGGAGGSLDAGGGSTGSGWNLGTDAYNFHTTPTKSTNYLGEEVSSGWGIGGTTNMNGSDGWIYLVRCEDVTKYLDMGLVMTYQPTIIEDAGEIDSAIANIEDAGQILGVIDVEEDAGVLLIPVDGTPWVLGNITDEVTEIENCGNIIGEM